MQPRCQFVLSPRCFNDMFGRRLTVVDAYISWGRLVINVEGVGCQTMDPGSVLIKEFNSLNQLRNWIGGQPLNGSNVQDKVYNTQSGGCQRRASGPHAIQ